MPCSVMVIGTEPIQTLFYQYIYIYIYICITTPFGKNIFLTQNQHTLIECFKKNVLIGFFLILFLSWTLLLRFSWVCIYICVDTHKETHRYIRLPCCVHTHTLSVLIIYWVSIVYIKIYPSKNPWNNCTHQPTVTVNCPQECAGTVHFSI